MGWKPPTKKAFDAGEIPGKRVITDEQQKNLDDNRPSRDVEALLGGNPKDRESHWEDIPESQQDELTKLLPLAQNQDISDFLDELKDSKDFGQRQGVLDAIFDSAVSSEIGQAGKQFMVSDVLRIAYLKELRSLMFYFGIGDVDDELRIVVTPIPGWEESKTWDISGISDIVIPTFLTKVRDSVFDFDTDFTISQIRKKMVLLGFIENHEIVE